MNYYNYFRVVLVCKDLEVNLENQGNQENQVCILLYYYYYYLIGLLLYANIYDFMSICTSNDAYYIIINL